MTWSCVICNMCMHMYMCMCMSSCISVKLSGAVCPTRALWSDDDDTFKILNASFHGKGKGGFAQICAHRRQPDPCLILESPSYRRNDKNQGKFVSFKKNFNHTYYKFHQPRFFNANGYVWNYLTHVKVSWIQNEFVRSLFLPKCQPKIWRISALLRAE